MPITWEFELEGDGNRQFTDPVHIYSFLNYLYRTDVDQKWTCAETGRNLDIVDGNAIMFGGRAQSMHDAAKQRIELAEGERISESRAAKRDLRTFLIRAADDPGDAGWERLWDVTSMACERAGLFLLVAVVHLDQGGPHMHGIYKRRKGMRGNPFLKAWNETLSDLGA